MLKIAKYFLTAALLLIPLQGEARPMGRKQRLRQQEGELLVRFKKGATQSERLGVLNRRGHVPGRRLRARGLDRVILSPGETVESAMAAYRSQIRSGIVEDVQPNFRYYTTAVPNDPLYPNYWGLKNSGQTIPTLAGSPEAPVATANPGTAGNDMGMETAWDLVNDCGSVVVAVIDTGINYTHEDLQGNLWDGGAAFPNHGYDFVDDTNDPMDTNGHGTHVAGTIGAVGNNSLGGTGVCWKVKLMAVRVLDATGAGTTASVVAGINFAVEHGAKVINMSLGGGGLDTATRTAIQNAGAQGVIVVVAAGNDGGDNDGSGGATYPCNYNEPNEICVAALTQTNGLASFSNYGATSVHVGAPGVNIVSPWNGTPTPAPQSFAAAGTPNGWTFTKTGKGWGFGSHTFGATVYDILANPPNWTGTNFRQYDSNSADVAYKTFDLSTADSASVSFYADYDLQTNKDHVLVACNPNGGDPFGTGTVLLDDYTGSTAGNALYTAYELKGCLSATASFGYKLTSDASGVRPGAAMLLLSVDSLDINPTTYNVIAGTSMATPHVAGLAALLFAYNPDFQYADVVAAIKAGGTDVPALAGKTSTGKAVNAAQSLSYIAAPTGLTVAK